MNLLRKVPGRSGSSPAPVPPDSGNGAVPARETAAEIAAAATRLIVLSHGAALPAAAVAELERAVLAQVEATQSLRRYPLRNSDEPMTVSGRSPGERP